MHYLNIKDYIQGEENRLELLKESNIENTLIIKKLFLSDKKRGVKDYSVTQEVSELRIDAYGVMNDRHRETSGFRESLREGHIYPKGSLIRQERHILLGTDAMADRISMEMGVAVDASLLAWNIVLGRLDGGEVFLDGLPLGTDIMVYPSEIDDIGDTTKLIVNLRISTFQKGCGITGKSIADAHNDPKQLLNFIKKSHYYRGAICAIDGPKGEHTLKVGQKVFIGLPTGYIH